MMIQTESGQTFELPDGAQPADIDDAISHYQNLQPPSFTDQVSNNLLQTAMRSASGQDSIPETGLGIANAITAPAISTAINAVKPAIQPVINAAQAPLQSVANAIDSTSRGQDAGDFLMTNVPKITNALSQFAQNNPRLTRDISELGNVMGAGGLVKGAGGLADLTGSMGEGSGVSPNLAAFGFPGAKDMILPSLQSRDAIDAVNNGLQDTKNTGYANAKTQGAVLTPAASDHVAITVPQQVESTLGIRLDPNDPTYSQTRSALTNLQNKSDMGLSTNDLEQTRQRLNDILNGSASGGDRTAAIVAKKALDNVYTQIQQNPSMLVGGNAAAVQSFMDARYANGVYQRYSDIADIVQDARGNPNKIQSAFQKLVSSKNENDFNLYAPDEQAKIESIAYPGGKNPAMTGQGITDKAVKGMGVLGGGLAGYAAGEAVGSPIVGATIGAATGAGSAINSAIKSRNILKGADTLLQNIAAKSKPITPYVAPIVEKKP